MPEPVTTRWYTDMRIKKYILRGKKVQEIMDSEVWAQWFETAARAKGERGEE